MKYFLFKLAISVCLSAAAATILLEAPRPVHANETAGSPQKYTIRQGDTLAKIAYRYYGDGKKYEFLARSNDIADPHVIFYGRALTIPASETVKAPAAGQTAAAQPEPAAPAPTPEEAVKPAAPLPAECMAAVPAPAHVPEVASPLSIAAEPPVPPFVWKKETNNAFSPDERLEFAIYWQFVNVGSASMAIEGIKEFNGRQAYHIVTRANSAPFFDNFFKVRDVNESYMDVESLSSLKYESHLAEGGYRKDETIILDQQNKKFTITESGKTGDIAEWTRDVLSAMYYLRTRDLAEGKEYMIDAHAGDKNWPLTVKVHKREKVKTPAGEFDCWLVEPSLRESAGIFQSTSKLWVWLTCDEKKTPVLMRSKIAVGSIEARLCGKK